ncbi:hypothetical protein M1N66_02005 [Thermodesulfovibrionales bacterium]|nr:hypothetical protein [Thermodesulfovibrionales bacterium]MCL0038380.1 hypothetical protein [Thermodesulfovibrionales bacterium]MCL0074757.1 hypothetical protein [Thermodesulfovibrionales bacterium]MCL0096367.1 hypothetical protein [Thermodesulfovibrionales bacterium]
MLEYVITHEAILWWLAILPLVSLVAFAVTIAMVPVLVAIIPVDYFTNRKRRSGRYRKLHPTLYFILIFIKNFFGVLFVVAGFVLLFLPGQGIITILVGLMLMNFPGKVAIERWFAKRPGVISAINWIRAKRNLPPIQAPK